MITVNSTPAVQTFAVLDASTRGSLISEVYMESKTCTKCGEDKPLTEYYKGKSSCKHCRCVARREWRAKNRERKREYDRAWRAKNPEVVLAGVRRWKRENRKAVLAGKRLRMGVARGSKLAPKRPDQCSTCGCKCVPVGHHEDYDKPYEVEWLCKSCHAVVHGRTK